MTLTRTKFALLTVLLANIAFGGEILDEKSLDNLSIEESHPVTCLSQTGFTLDEELVSNLCSLGTDSYHEIILPERYASHVISEETQSPSTLRVSYLNNDLPPPASPEIVK